MDDALLAVFHPADQLRHGTHGAVDTPASGLEKRHGQQAQNGRGEHDAVKAEVARLSQYEKNEIDQSEYEHFLNCIKLLTAKEKEIFDLYIQGNSSKEILKLENISENTLKYHNRNIYSKLGVSSRKQLLLYASMMKESEQA